MDSVGPCEEEGTSQSRTEYVWEVVTRVILKVTVNIGGSVRKDIGSEEQKTGEEVTRNDVKSVK